jgi:hypothetical protein
MSDNFTYEEPDEKAYFKTLLEYLRIKGESEIVDLLKGAKCAIQSSSTFSKRRWNAMWTIIYFYVPISKLELVNEEIKRKLIGFCVDIMPAEVGFDVMDIEFSPLMESIEDLSEINTQETLIEDLENISQIISQEIISQILPDDIKQKGKDMAEVYLYLYCVENSLRLFIEKVAKDRLGDGYFDQLKLNKGIRENVSHRKQQESKNKWLRLRGDSEIFYLDFKDLGTIIQNNWDLFSSYFPDQSWILTKINELGECRNLVAHNSFIQNHEKDVIRVYYNSILKQLNDTLRSK